MSSISSSGKSQLNKRFADKSLCPPSRSSLHQRIFSTPLNEKKKKKKKKLIQNMLKGYGKFAYSYGNIRQEIIIEGFKNKKLNLSEIRFKMLTVKDYKELEEKLKE